VDDPPRQSDGAREVVVEVDREVVSRGFRVPDRLVVCDRIRDLCGGLFLRVEPVVGRALADALRRLHAPEELGDVLLVEKLPVLVPCLGPDDDRRSVGAAEEARPASLVSAPASRGERPVHDDVLLVVHDLRANVVRGDRAGDLTAAAQTGRRANTGPPTTSSVASA
jgi:hypothetical protein